MTGNCSLVAEHRGLTACLSNSDESAAIKYFHRSMLAQGVYQVDSASDGIKSSWVKNEPCLEGSGSPGHRRDDLPEQAAAVVDLWVGGTSQRPLARVFGCSAPTLRRAQAESGRAPGNSEDPVPID